ncbi:hypothetical protein LR48_Vigan04g045600 [Vigna angularis]|uniref:Uncharacterized protein n=1 Tax=Phaseolus angularis TaxID=3914 RepID=A0A0L9UBW6_PHAAN|nr:protein SOB FIVE-LIKE 3 [Vigna angularis]KAG2399017.1 uncharacterized protein HKW66_Vig0085010 [Vigna angularis]KOM40258.1 hypothetical protein LR48_Vigan04g045600 [Vigna angularis]
MEPPHLRMGGEEECHSNESGWTMYIGSPRDEDAHCDDNEDKGFSLDYDYEEAEADADVESDDSMASDASSGPSQYGVSNPLGGGCDGITQFQQKEEGKNKYSSDHKAKGNHQVVEKRAEKNHKKMVLISSKGKAPAV